MKNLLLLILTINVVILADDKAEKSSSIYNRNTLQYALHKAHSTHPELMNLKFSVDASEYGYEASKGSWLPTLDLSSRLGPETNSTRYFGDDSSINGRSENENIEIYNARLRQVIFDGGLRDSIIDQSHERLSQSRFNYDETLESVSYAVINAYVDIIKQTKLLSLAEDNFLKHKDLYDKVKKRFDLKRETQVSLSQAQSRLLRAKNSVVQFKYNLSQAKVAYYQLVGEKAPDELVDISLESFNLVDNLFNAFSVSESHPALKRADSQVTESKANVQQSESQFLPEFAIEGNASYDRYLNGFQSESDEYSLLFTANWNIFNGFQDSKNYQASLSRLSASKSAKQSVFREIRGNVEDSWIEVIKLRENAEILKEQKELAIFTAEGYVEQYDKSSRSLFDVLNTQTDAFNSEISYTTALYDEVVAYASLGFFMGDLTKRVKGYKFVKNSNIK